MRIGEYLCVVLLAGAGVGAACSSSGESSTAGSANSTAVTTAVTTAVDATTTTTVERPDGDTDVGTGDLPPQPDDPARAALTSGVVAGEVIDGVRTFLGIPYAQPPVGDLRWAAPEPVGPWDDVLDVSDLPNICPQIVPIVNTPEGEEDCLYLSVFAPEGADGSTPVMVWIHGGGFAVGNGLQNDGSVLAADHGVVVVQVNYRLGPLGFLALPTLVDEVADGSTGNYGILDQRLALQWVQENVGAFGGDPDNVTIFGESAGGWSVCSHLLSTGSAGLFHQAISQSGLCVLPAPTLDQAYPQSVRVADQLGCAADDLGCLRSADVTDVINAQPPPPSLAFGEGARWGPTLDGVVLTAQPEALFGAGEFNKVPVLLGSNANEGSIFTLLEFDVPGVDLTEERYRDEVALFSGEANVDAVIDQYPPDEFGGMKESLAQLMGEGFINCPVRTTTQLLAEHVPVYSYGFTFADAPFYFTLPGVDLGAYHSGEIQYVFGTDKPGGQGQGHEFSSDEQMLTSHLTDYWTRFATTGDPNGGDSPTWPLYSIETDESLLLDVEPVVGSGFMADSCSFWYELEYLQPFTHD